MAGMCATSGRTSAVKPVRRITNFGRKVIGKFPSVKTGRAVWWESPLERDYVHLLEFDPDVVCYREQPLRIRYILDNTAHTYTPDFLVERASGRKQIIEVKPEEIAVSPEYQRFSRAISHVCEKDGFEFVTATDKTVRLQPRLDNVKILHRYSRVPILPDHIVECRRFLLNNREATLGRLTGHLRAKGIGTRVAYALVSRGLVIVDLGAPLGASSTVAWSQRDTRVEKEVSA